MPRIVPLLGTVLFLVSTTLFALTSDDAAQVDAIIAANEFHISPEDLATLKAFGPDVVDHVLQRYQQADEDRQKAKLAAVMWSLGMKNETATDVLLQDIHAGDETLRINVQYALGSLSSSPVVVNALLDNMRNDDNPLFRDKAACTLAYDQIHLDPQQKYFLYRGLIEGLGDEKAQVRDISIRALEIHTGQRFGFAAKSGPQQRSAAITRWNAWLKDYQKSL